MLKDHIIQRTEYEICVELSLMMHHLGHEPINTLILFYVHSSIHPLCYKTLILDQFHSLAETGVHLRLS